MSDRSRLPSLSWRKILKALNRAGFFPVRQSSSHILLWNLQGKRVTLPRHDPVGRGLPMEILAEAGINREEFLKLL